MTALQEARTYMLALSMAAAAWKHWRRRSNLH
jgi:hypothetical protein